MATDVFHVAGLVCHSSLLCCYMKPYSEHLARRSAGIHGEPALISRPLGRHVESSSTKAQLSYQPSIGLQRANEASDQLLKTIPCGDLAFSARSVQCLLARSRIRHGPHCTQKGAQLREKQVQGRLLHSSALLSLDRILVQPPQTRSGVRIIELISQSTPGN